MEVRIVDPHTGAALPPGEKGEIAVKGLTLMSGYAKVEPELFLDADGFFHTQDGGHLDAEGELHWTGRLSNLIKTGGANVSPLEIEERAGRFPGVRSAHAVGVPHPTLGEAIVLCVVPTAGAAVDVPGLEAFLREALSAYKLPRAVFVLRPDEVSYTGSQKVQVEPLRELRAREALRERASRSPATLRPLTDSGRALPEARSWRTEPRERAPLELERWPPPGPLEGRRAPRPARQSAPQPNGSRRAARRLGHRARTGPLARRPGR